MVGAAMLGEVSMVDEHSRVGSLEGGILWYSVLALWRGYSVVSCACSLEAGGYVMLAPWGVYCGYWLSFIPKL